jgi:hypothetical protein
VAQRLARTFSACQSDFYWWDFIKCHRLSDEKLEGQYNFEQYSNFFQSGPIVDPAKCGGGGLDRNRMYKMPNSLITFNQFWESQGSTTEPDQVARFFSFSSVVRQLCPCRG